MRIFHTFAQTDLELHLFFQREKTTKDFIQTRCHSFKMLCQNHWDQNQKSRLRFQSHNPAKILWQLNLNTSVLWTDWDNLTSSTRRRILVFMASTSDKLAEGAWTSTSTGNPTPLDIHLHVLSLMKRILLIFLFVFYLANH